MLFTLIIGMYRISLRSYLNIMDLNTVLISIIRLGKKYGESSLTTTSAMYRGNLRIK